MPRALAPLVDHVARQSLGKDWGLYAALLSHWTEIVGTDYARVATPVKMTFPHQPQNARREGGTLTIRLPKGLALEFSFKAEQIRQRINHYFGYSAFARVVGEPVYGAVPKPPPPPLRELAPEALAQIKTRVQAVGSDDLSAALESLGTALSQVP